MITKNITEICIVHLIIYTTIGKIDKTDEEEERAKAVLAHFICRTYDDIWSFT